MSHEELLTDVTITRIFAAVGKEELLLDVATTEIVTAMDCQEPS